MHLPHISQYTNRNNNTMHLPHISQYTIQNRSILIHDHILSHHKTVPWVLFVEIKTQLYGIINEETGFHLDPCLGSLLAYFHGTNISSITTNIQIGNTWLIAIVHTIKPNRKNLIYK